MRISLLFLLFVFTLSQGTLIAQNYGGSSSDFSILFYNTENFFDCENDTTKSDEEYLANAFKNWTPQRFRLKAERLAKVIVAAGKWNSPLLVGLCEVENRDVLESLVRMEPLTKYHYKIIQKDSPDPRGIDVALLYRPNFFRPIDYDAIPVVDINNPKFKTRDILKVIGIMANSDTVVVYINHWPSRYGGIMETKKYRILAAEKLKLSISEDFKKNTSAKIVCMGDFNDTPSDESIVGLLESKSYRGQKLVNLSANWTSEDIQTIKSRHRWEIFDQFIVSSGFIGDQKRITFVSAEICKAGFLLEKDEKYGGVKPKRTYLGFKYNDGFSDHLPVVLRFQLPVH